MNHFRLPGTGKNTGGDATRFGVHLMKLLINGLLKQGARRDRLEAKNFLAALRPSRPFLTSGSRMPYSPPNF